MSGTQPDTVLVTFHLSIGLIGCKRSEEVEIDRADLPDDPVAREEFLQGYAEDVFNGEVEMYWRIEDDQ
jgi:hypothetical protein